MPRAEITKHAIARSTKELMDLMPFASISVSDITRRCGINRNTFYYHFRDKFDVIRWIFYTEITPIIRDSGDRGQWADHLIRLCRYMQENRTFYLNALTVAGQNSFIECLMEFYQSLVAGILRSADRDGSLSAEDADFVSRFYAYPLIGIVLDWAREGMTADPQPTIRRLERLVNGQLLGDIARQLSADPAGEKDRR